MRRIGSHAACRLSQVCLFMAFIIFTITFGFTQEPEKENIAPKEETVQEETETKAEEQTATVESLAKSGNVTLDFKEADIRNVLKIISYKAGVNIVTTPEVMGNVTIRLVDVPWEEALEAILKTYGFAYDRVGNIITVAPMEKLTALKQQEVALTQVQPTVTEVFNLKYIDAEDAKKALEAQLSPRGKITVLETTGQAGWEFGSDDKKRERIGKGRVSRSKTLIISDMPPILEKLEEILQKIDVQPQQIIIQAKLVEVNHDKIKDLGFSWGTGTEGRTALTIERPPVTVYYWTKETETEPSVLKTYKDIVSLSTLPLSSKGNKVLGMQSIPSLGISELIFQKLAGIEFETVLKALEDKSFANTLSAPHIMTLNNQEAAILIGNKYPLIETSVSAEGAITGQKLGEYQNIGIQLNVVPQISGKDYINLIAHPVVSSYSETVKSVSASGVTMAEFPIITVREAETQILMKDGETVVIGGLMKDVKSDQRKGIPILMDIPLLGFFFRRDYTTTTKVDLLIFLTAHIVKEGEFTPEEITKLEERLGRGPQKPKK